MTGPIFAHNIWKSAKAAAAPARIAPAAPTASEPASYIDAAIFRDGFDPEGWTDVSEEAFARRDYLLQNWRNDTVVVVRASGQLVEFVQYSVNGIPFGIPAGDAYSDGNVTIDDMTRFVDWWGNSAWDPRTDLNADGVLDIDDYYLFASAWMGRGVLSQVNNRIGYAGYQHAPELGGTVWHVRHRWLNSERGDWLSRDPLGYVDGMHLYEYAMGTPLVAVDPMGLFFWWTPRHHELQAWWMHGMMRRLSLTLTAYSELTGAANPLKKIKGPAKRIKACAECAEGLARAARATDFTRVRCDNCCINYVCTWCPTDPTIPNGTPQGCMVNCEACCLDRVCMDVNRVWRELPACIECAWQVPNLDLFWPSQIANCRPDRYGAVNACNAETRAKLLRCRSRKAWDGCPPVPRFPTVVPTSPGHSVGQE